MCRRLSTSISASRSWAIDDAGCMSSVKRGKLPKVVEDQMNRRVE